MVDKLQEEIDRVFQGERANTMKGLHAGTYMAKLLEYLEEEVKTKDEKYARFLLKITQQILEAGSLLDDAREAQENMGDLIDKMGQGLTKAKEQEQNLKRIQKAWASRDYDEMTVLMLQSGRYDKDELKAMKAEGVFEKEYAEFADQELLTYEETLNEIQGYAAKYQEEKQQYDERMAKLKGMHDDLSNQNIDDPKIQDALDKLKKDMTELETKQVDLDNRFGKLTIDLKERTNVTTFRKAFVECLSTDNSNNYYNLERKSEIEEKENIAIAANFNKQATAEKPSEEPNTPKEKVEENYKVGDSNLNSGFSFS